MIKLYNFVNILGFGMDISCMSMVIFLLIFNILSFSTNSIYSRPDYKSIRYLKSKMKRKDRPRARYSSVRKKREIGDSDWSKKLDDWYKGLSREEFIGYRLKELEDQFMPKNDESIQNKLFEINYEKMSFQPGSEERKKELENLEKKYKEELERQRSKSHDGLNSYIIRKNIIEADSDTSFQNAVTDFARSLTRKEAEAELSKISGYTQDENRQSFLRNKLEEQIDNFKKINEMPEEEVKKKLREIYDYLFPNKEPTKVQKEVIDLLEARKKEIEDIKEKEKTKWWSIFKIFSKNNVDEKNTSELTGHKKDKGKGLQEDLESYFEKHRDF